MMVTQDPKTQGVPGALGIILGFTIKPYNQLKSEKRSVQTWVKSLQSWLRLLFTDIVVRVVSEWSVTRKPGPTTLALQGCLQETKAPFFGAWGPDCW